MPERAADGDDQLADLERARIAERRRGQAGLVDLDDGQVGQGVDAVDRALQDAAVAELDLHRVAAFDDVAVGQDPAVAVVDDAGADAGLRDDPEIGVGRAGGRDADHGRADRRGDVDGRRRFIDGHGLVRPDGRAGATGRDGRRSIEGAGRVQGDDRAARGEDRRQERGRDDRARATALAATVRGRDRLGRHDRGRGQGGGLVPALRARCRRVRCATTRGVPRTAGSSGPRSAAGGGTATLAPRTGVGAGRLAGGRRRGAAVGRSCWRVISSGSDGSRWSWSWSSAVCIGTPGRLDRPVSGR